MGSARQDVRDEALCLLNETAHEVVKSIIEQVPAYAALSRAQVDEVRQIAGWATARLLDLWVESRDLTDSDIRRFKGIGAARALDGRPLPAVLRAYRLAGSHIVELIERVGGSRLSASDATALARLWMASIDTLSEALFAGYDAATTRFTVDRQPAIGDLIEDLLVGRQVTRTGLADRGRELGITLDANPTLMLLVAKEPERPLNGEALEAALTGLWRELGENHASRTLAHVRAGVGVLLLPAELDGKADTVLVRQWRGVRVADLKITDLPRAFRLAGNLLEHAPERAFADRAFLEESDAQLMALLTGHPEGDPDRLRSLVLAELTLRGAEHLLEGLDAYLASGSASEAAESLGLHAQTMRHRLRRIVELTNRDPRRPWDRLVIEAAVMARTTPAGRSRPNHRQPLSGSDAVRWPGLRI